MSFHLKTPDPITLELLNYTLKLLKMSLVITEISISIKTKKIARKF